MNNKSTFRPKGSSVILYMLLCVVSATASIIFTLTTANKDGLTGIIVLTAAVGLYALGSVIASSSKKSAGTWLLSILQSVMLVVLSATFVVSILLLTVGTSVFGIDLAGIVDRIFQLVGLKQINRDSLNSTWLIICAAVSCIGLLHCITSFSASSALKKYYKGENNAGCTVLFGFLSLILAAAKLAVFSLAGWACTDTAALPDWLSAAREQLRPLDRTFDFGSYTVSDWAYLVWVAASSLAFLALAGCAFRVSNTVSNRKKSAFDNSFATLSSPTAPSEDSFFEDIPEENDSAASGGSFNDTFEMFPEADETMIIGDSDAGMTSESAAPVFADSADDFPADDFDEPFAPSPDPEPFMTPNSFREDVFTDSPIDAADSVDNEFADCTVTTAAAAVTVLPGVGDILDYGYSENTII